MIIFVYKEFLAFNQHNIFKTLIFKYTEDTKVQKTIKLFANENYPNHIVKC